MNFGNGYQPAYNPYASSMPFPPRQDFGVPNYLPQVQNNQQMQQPQQAQQQGYLCRPVTSREEAVAVQVDFTGPGTIMPDLSHGMIYLKRFNPNTGASDFLPFAFQSTPVDNEKTDTKISFASLKDVMDLQNEIKRLSDEVERLKKPSSGKAVRKNDSDE